jgi:glucosamine-6-phosphate deaminase
MEVIILPTRERACALAARIVTDAVTAKPDIVLGLATGRTMEAVYELLTGLHHAEGVSYARVTTFNLDEYIGLGPEHPGSYRHYMNTRFFERIDVKLENTFIPLGTAPDLDLECRAYEDTIKAKGGIDLQLLGLGESGHIGFNEPLSALASRTRAKALTPQTRAQNMHLFPAPGAMPTRAITMGVGTILEARRCLLLVTGARKAEILSRAVEGPITAMVSATALQLHPRCTVIVDEAAASRLSQIDYYRWIYENEPEWERYRQAFPP